jgi:hypothetical protein
MMRRIVTSESLSRGVWPVPPEVRCARTRDDTLVQIYLAHEPDRHRPDKPARWRGPAPPGFGAKPVVRASGQSVPLDQIGQWPGRWTEPMVL